MLSKLYNQFICSSLMLPEHREALTKHHLDERQEEERYVPEVDERQLEMWEYLIKESLSQKKKLGVTYLSGSARKTITGVAVEAGNSALRIKDENTARTERVDFGKIIAVGEK